MSAWHLPAEPQTPSGTRVRPPLDLNQIDVPLSGPPGSMKDPADNR